MYHFNNIHVTVPLNMLIYDSGIYIVGKVAEGSMCERRGYSYYWNQDTKSIVELNIRQFFFIQYVTWHRRFGWI